MNSNGICYLVGAGPGDPGLLTLRGRDCLNQAEVIVYDYLANPELLGHAPADAERVYVGKKAGDHTMTQEQINAMLVKKTAAGKIVVRLKGGDPFVFGRGGEEAQALVAHGLRFEVVPGISSAIAAPAYAGIPVTHRGCGAQLTIFTGHEKPDKTESGIDFAGIARNPGTSVMLMGAERLGPICERLIQAGAPADRPAAFIQWGTLPRQQTVQATVGTLAEKVAEAGLTAPAIVVFGQSAALREELKWKETRPLWGKRIVVTRTREQAGVLSRQLAMAGAEVTELPTIRHLPAPDPEAFARMVVDAHLYDWLIFTSPRGVEAYFDRFYQIYRDARELGSARIAVIGNGTAAKVREYRFKVDIIPEEAVAERFVEAIMAAGSVENLRMLVVRPEQARDVVSLKLSEAGAIVDEAVAYRTVPAEDDSDLLPALRKQKPDLITFTSSSTVENFLRLIGRWPLGWEAASIGPITSGTLRQNGIEPAIEAFKHNIPGFVEAICDHYDVD